MAWKLVTDPFWFSKNPLLKRFCGGQYDVKALKINSKVEHDFNSVLEGFRNYYSTLASNLVKMLPKPTNKYSINSVIKYYEHMILGDYFHLASVSENSILNI